jgi:hypothetical protein
LKEKRGITPLAEQDLEAIADYPYFSSKVIDYVVQFT